MVKTFADRIRRLKEIGLTVLLAEQNLKFTLGLSDYGYIIDNGRIRYQGTVAELVDNPEVRKLCGLVTSQKPDLCVVLRLAGAAAYRRYASRRMACTP